MQSVKGWGHVYRRNNGTLYYVRRVPTDLVGAVKERQFKRSLKHRDERLPGFKSAYDAVHHEVEALIASLRQGHSAPEARRDYELAVARSQRLGFDFRPMSELARDRSNTDDLLARLTALES